MILSPWKYRNLAFNLLIHFVNSLCWFLKFFDVMIVSEGVCKEFNTIQNTCEFFN